MEISSDFRLCFLNRKLNKFLYFCVVRYARRWEGGKILAAKIR